MFSKTALFFSALLAAASVNAHMHMSDPPPLGAKENKNTPSASINSDINSPLLATGANFPCQGQLSAIGTPAGASVATWEAGSQQSFTIAPPGAPHNGGSCQASLSEDGGKTWKVMKSFIGSCPTLSGGSFPFTVPSEAKAGEAIFAWTWFNEVGNREMYMNCAAVTISGSGGSGLSAFPDMFVANVGNGCTSNAEGTGDLMFPDPGKDVTNTASKSAPPVGNCGASPGGSGGSGASDASSAAPAKPTPTTTFNDGLYHPSTSATAEATLAPTKASPSEAAEPSGEAYNIVMVINGTTQSGLAYLTKATPTAAARHRYHRRSYKFMA